jgi:hypothetical protein
MSNHNPYIYIPTNAAFYGGGEGVVPQAEADAVGLTVACLSVFGLCLMTIFSPDIISINWHYGRWSKM